MNTDAQVSPVVVEALRDKGTAIMLALSTYAQACLDLAATYPVESASRSKWQDRAEASLGTVRAFYA